MLQEKYGGWQNASMVNYFNDFANLCFERFGNRVKYWITFNNPWVRRLRTDGAFTVTAECLTAVLCLQSVAVEGYETGEHAPGLKLKGTGAYKAAHHIIKVGLGRVQWGASSLVAVWGPHTTWVQDHLTSALNEVCTRSQHFTPVSVALVCT